MDGVSWKELTLPDEKLDASADWPHQCHVI